MVLSDCVCPGHELRLECTYMNGIATLWRGSAFDCPELNNEILLQHYYCPVVEYKVTAVNCGVCPTATHNTSITCVVDDVTTVIDNLCILSIQSVFCRVTGENRTNVTATLRGIANFLIENIAEILSLYF